MKNRPKNKSNGNKDIKKKQTGTPPKNHNQNIIILRLNTPTHVGASKSQIGIDKPIQREIVTSIPKIESSSLKGSLRSHATDKEIFGDIKDASSVVVSDGKLLLFPIRSSHQIFQYITCPYIIKGLNTLYRSVDRDNLFNEELIKYLDKIEFGYYYHWKSTKQKTVDEESYYLGDEIYHGMAMLGDHPFATLGLKDVDCSQIGIVSDEDFIYMVETYTHVTMRNRIDEETGKTKKGGLFTEEYLPMHTVLYAQLINMKNNGYTVSSSSQIQIGGNETLGKGNVDVYNLQPNKQEKDKQNGEGAITCTYGKNTIRENHIHDSVLAYNQVEAFKKDVKTYIDTKINKSGSTDDKVNKEQEELLKEYKSHIRRLPTLIHKNGALNTMLYIKAKTIKNKVAVGSDNEVTKPNTWSSIYQGLNEGILTKEQRDKDVEDHDILIHTTIEAYDNQQIRMVTKRMLHYVITLKRLVEGLIDDKDDSHGN